MPRFCHHFYCYLIAAGIMAVLMGCGGGSSGSHESFKSDPVLSSAIISSSSSVSVNASSLSSSSASSTVLQNLSSSNSGVVSVSGIVTYDYVPHNLNHVGLNYSAIEKRPSRGVVVELINESGVLLGSTITAADGSYAFNTQKNIVAKVRVKAELARNTAPSWNFKVTDNTSGNIPYVLDGTLTSVGDINSQRNLHAPSGWDGSAYTSPRAAAPFAILDNIYIGANRLLAAGNNRNLPLLELRWSVKNSTADGDLSRGEIGTSFFNGNAIYILGDANNDSDEYDSHVLLHEWGHYLEESLFRSDSLGGNHADGQILDMRVSMSEGFANAFSAMMLDDGNYSDASGSNQKSGFTFNVGKKNRASKGFYSEGSVGSIFYNYYLSQTNKIANDFTPIFQVLNTTGYYNNEAMTSIYLFFSQLKLRLADQVSAFSNLMLEQNIYGDDEYGNNESNNAGLSIALPLYRILPPDNTSINVCSSPEFGKQNKLGNAQLLKFSIAQTGNYSFKAARSNASAVTSKPEIVVYDHGYPVLYVKNSINDTASGSVLLARGIYVVEIYDANNRDADNTEQNTTCFSVRASLN